MTTATSTPTPTASDGTARSVPIGLFDLKRQRSRLGDSLQDRIARVLEHTQFVLGPEVEELEERLADYTGARHVIGVSSGRDAIAMALMAVDVGPGDAVFIPSFTFSATAGAVVAVGATPVFVDVDEATFNMDAASLERAIVRTAKRGELSPRAVVPVDLFGVPADYPVLNAIAKVHGLKVVADAAQSFGGVRAGTSVGKLAQISTTSFYPTKPLGGYGDGGAVLTDDDELAALVKQIRNHGRQGSGDEALRLGMTGRLDTLQAAVLLVKLDVFDEELDRRRKIAANYSRAFADHVIVPVVPDDVRSAWALYTIRVADRAAFQARLKEAGVGSGIFYPTPLHRHPAFAQWHAAELSLPASERLADEVISLPLHCDLSDGEVGRVIDAVQHCLAGGTQFSKAMPPKKPAPASQASRSVSR